jgi:hypothetical protein
MTKAAILEFLWSGDTGLPVDCFAEKDVKIKAEGWGQSVVETLAADLQRELAPRGRIFRLEPLADESVPRKLPHFGKTRTAGARNRLEPQPGHLGALFRSPSTGILPAHDPQVRLVKECVN